MGSISLVLDSYLSCRYSGNPTQRPGPPDPSTRHRTSLPKKQRMETVRNDDQSPTDNTLTVQEPATLTNIMAATEVPENPQRALRIME